MYILIIVLAFSGSVATTTAEFGNLTSCQKAADAVRAEMGWLTKVKTFCVEKRAM